MRWDRARRDRVLRRYRRIVRIVGPLFFLGMWLTVAGLVRIVTGGSGTLLILGALLLLASGVSLYRAVVSTVRIVELDEAEDVRSVDGGSR